MTEPIVSKERTSVLARDPDERFGVPFCYGDFEEAPDLEMLGDALIETCKEFEDIRWAREEGEMAILYRWQKKASKSADRVVSGSLARAAGLVRHLSDSEYVIKIAADINYMATNWQMEALVFHELMHIKINRQVVGKGENIVLVPELKVKAHDLEMFWAEVNRYGLWRRDLEQAQKTFEQAPLFATPQAKPKSENDQVRAPRGRRSTSRGVVSAVITAADRHGLSS